jgi:hypothetical protein
MMAVSFVDGTFAYPTYLVNVVEPLRENICIAF